MGSVNGSELSPVQSAFRFLIEMAALVCWGIVGWQLADGVARWILVGVLPVAAATIWGTFRTPDDRSAKGHAPIAVPGPIRLVIELCVLLGAAVSITFVWRPAVGVALAAAVLLHLATTPRRIRWLLDQRLD